ncbi:MAG: response regulator [Spirochaetales bacterium]|nr:response regulator [Spirochaetales bacterium]
MDKIKILAVDDEESVINIIKNVCRNHDLTTETSSLKAVTLLKNRKFDIFIVDYQMPGMNGIELLKKIQETYNDGQFVCIFCTAYGTIHLFKEELVSGLFTYFVEKPFTVEALKEVVNKAIIELGKRINNAKHQDTAG